MLDILCRFRLTESYRFCVKKYVVLDLEKQKRKKVTEYLNIHISSNFLSPDEFCRHEHFEIMDVRQ